MESIKVPACSFKAMLHPEYEAIKAECEPWILDLMAPPSTAAAEFYRACLFPYFSCLCYAPCLTKRVAFLVKLNAWGYACDTEDDTPSARGSVPDLAGQRHPLMLACFAGEQLLDLPAAACGSDGSLAALLELWKDIAKDMSPTMRSRYISAVKSHLNANKVQAEYRKANRLPSVDEYIELRRHSSSGSACFLLLEYGLDIELDDETLGSELLQRLHDAATDHLCVYNDVLSFQAELHVGDYFNLPSVILAAKMKAESAAGFTLVEAVQEAVSMVEEVDKLCAQLMTEAKNSRLVEKPGVKEYLDGLAGWLAGSVEWARRTARYTHACSSQGVVTPLPAQLQVMQGSPSFSP